MAEAVAVGYQGAASENYHLLIRTIDPTTELLNELESRCRRYRLEIQSVSTVPSTNDRAGRLLNLLVCNTDDVTIHEVFVSALRNYDQDHAANLLTRVQDGKQPLTDERFKLLQQNSAKLYELINPCNELLPQLQSLLVFRDHDVQRVKDAGPCLSAMSEELVSIVKRKSNCSYDKFLNALTKSKQQHVVFILTDGQRGLPPIGVELAQAVVKSMTDSVKNLDPFRTDLLAELVSHNVFMRGYEMNYVREGQSADIINQRILELMLRKPRQLFDDFREVLRKTKHDHVLHIIDRGVITVEVVASNDEQETVVPQQVEDDVAEDLEHGLEAVGFDRIDMYRNCIKLRFRGLSLKQIDEMELLYKSGELQSKLINLCQSALTKHRYGTIKLIVEPGEFERARNDFKQYALMTSDTREALLSAVNKLVHHIRVNAEFLELLPSLDGRRRRAVEAMTCNEEQVRTLLNVVSRCPAVTFQELVEALNKTGQRKAATILDDFLTGSNSQYKEIHDPVDRTPSEGGGAGQNGHFQRVLMNQAESGYHKSARSANRGSVETDPRSSAARKLVDESEDYGDFDLTETIRRLQISHRAELSRIAFEYREQLEKNTTAVNDTRASYKNMMSLAYSHADMQRDLITTQEEQSHQLVSLRAVVESTEDRLRKEFDTKLRLQGRSIEDRTETRMAQQIETLERKMNHFKTVLDGIGDERALQTRPYSDERKMNYPRQPRSMIYERGKEPSRSLMESD